MAYGSGTMGSNRIASPLNGTRNIRASADPTVLLSKTQEVKYGATSNKIFDISEDIDATKSTENIPTNLVIDNIGQVPLEIAVEMEDWTADATAAGDVETMHILLLPGESYTAPVRAIITSGSMTSAIIDGTPISNEAPNSNMYTDSTANVDDGAGLDIVGSSSETKVFLEPYTSAANCTANLFRIGDIIRVNNEIMEVTAIGDKSDLANNYLTVIRGLYGSTAASDHADGAAVRHAFFNSAYDYDHFTVCQTDSSGFFSANNFFGKGRTATGPSGLTPGSVLLKFFSKGYQALGLSSITSTTITGLAASTEYKINITINGGTTMENLAFTTDANNNRFGGTSGLIEKIQDALDEQYYLETSNIFEDKVIVSIIGGDLVFTSDSNRSTSAVLLANPTSGTTPWAKGRLRSAATMKDPVAARLPDTYEYDPRTYSQKPANQFAYDDGRGNILGGVCKGIVEYETGKISISSAPPLSEFVISCIENTAFSGRLNTDQTGRANCVSGVYANTTSQFKNGRVKVVTQ